MHAWQNCCFSCFYCRIFIVILDIFLLPDRFWVLVAFLARRVFCANLILKRKFSFMQVFSAFGFVHKITTFEKTAGFQVCMLKLIYPTYHCPLVSTQAHSVCDLCRRWCNSPMLKLPLLQKMPWMEETSLGDSCLIVDMVFSLTVIGANELKKNRHLFCNFRLLFSGPCLLLYFWCIVNFFITYLSLTHHYIPENKVST